jgi:phage gp16-like protein
MTAVDKESGRKRLIQLIHIGKGKLGWDDAAYRAFLRGVCGKESCAEMSVRQLRAVFSAMRDQGFKTGHVPLVSEEERGRASLAQLEYIKGMWRKCARNKSDAALGAMIKRIAHVDSIRFLDEAGARKVILALRDMMDMREKAGSAQ